MSQKELIRRHLENGESITPLEALNKYGCFRLGARIWELTHEDRLPIVSEIIEDKDSGKHFAKYYLNLPKQTELFAGQ